MMKLLMGSAFPKAAWHSRSPQILPLGPCHFSCVTWGQRFSLSVPLWWALYILMIARSYAWHLARTPPA